MVIEATIKPAPAIPTRWSRRRRFPWVAQIIAIVVAVLYAGPLYLLVNVGLKDKGGYGQPIIPAIPPQLSNFVDAWVGGDLGTALLNSLIVTTVSTSVVVLCASLAAYPLSRSMSRWSRASFAVFLLGLMVPFQISMIPLYLLFRDLGLLGTLPSIILYHCGSKLPLAILIYTMFLRNMDRDYEEAAAIDGCGVLRSFWYVVLPLARPVTATVAILIAVDTWNSFLPPLLFLRGGAETVPIALYSFVSSYINNWVLIFAGLIIGIAPILAVYFFMQKTIIQGFAGGLKG